LCSSSTPSEEGEGDGSWGSVFAVMVICNSCLEDGVKVDAALDWNDLEDRTWNSLSSMYYW
jgi:hypothetical protein